MHLKFLKNYGKALALIAVLFTQTFAARAADEMYQISWYGKIYSTNSLGKITITTYTAQDFINKLVADNGFSNPSQFSLVYRADRRDIVVVHTSNGAFLGNFFQFHYFYTDMANKAGTGTVRQAFINDEDHDSVIGSILGYENTTRDQLGNRTAYTFFGTFQFAIPETEGRWKNGVYSGNFSVGRKIP